MAYPNSIHNNHHHCEYCKSQDCEDDSVHSHEKHHVDNRVGDACFKIIKGIGQGAFAGAAVGLMLGGAIVAKVAIYVLIGLAIGAGLGASASLGPVMALTQSLFSYLIGAGAVIGGVAGTVNALTKN